jgi:hypothetical protein
MRGGGRTLCALPMNSSFGLGRTIGLCRLFESVGLRRSGRVDCAVQRCIDWLRICVGCAATDEPLRIDPKRKSARNVSLWDLVARLAERQAQRERDGLEHRRCRVRERCALQEHMLRTAKWMNGTAVGAAAPTVKRTVSEQSRMSSYGLSSHPIQSNPIL